MILQGVELAELLLTESSRISQLAKEGVFKRIGKGAYDLKESVQAYVRWQRDQQKRQTIISADSRVREARARDIEARTSQRLGQLVPLALYDEMIHGFAGVVRSELAGMAATCTRDLVMRRIIDRELNARLHRMAEYAKAKSVRVGALGLADDSQRGNGTGRVGSGE
jgi:hypothetical protein